MTFVQRQKVTMSRGKEEITYMVNHKRWKYPEDSILLNYNMLAGKLIWYFSRAKRDKKVESEQGIQFGEFMLYSFHCFHFYSRGKGNKNNSYCFTFEI